MILNLQREVMKTQQLKLFGQYFPTGKEKKGNSLISNVKTGARNTNYFSDIVIYLDLYSPK